MIASLSGPNSHRFKELKRGSTTPFYGFSIPTSNTTYCPNQFFDICLPHHSRGVVRLVGYMIRKTLGWCDANGNPQRERFAISYNELEKEGGVGRDSIKRAIDEAVRSKFINCLQKPSPKAAGRTSVTGLYELRWDHRDGYVKDRKLFDGFFAGEGNRTYIPNQFFDVCLRGETLALVKVVGSVIRFSIGFQNRWGFRRQQTPLSYLDIQRYAKIGDRTTLGEAIRSAVNSNYVHIVEQGYFDPHGGMGSRKATYAVRWLNDYAIDTIGRKTRPAENDETDQSENQTGIGRKSRPAERSENQTGIQITEINNTLKQQRAVGSGQRADNAKPLSAGRTPPAGSAVTFEKLKAEGFDHRAAEAIAKRYPAERIERQIRWLSQRRIKANRLGMLRAAIDQDWSEPGRLDLLQELRQRNSEGGQRGIGFEGAIEEVKRRFKHQS